MAQAAMQIDLNVQYGRWWMNSDVQIKYSSANYDAFFFSLHLKMKLKIT